jgi:hypothetical protein
MNAENEYFHLEAKNVLVTIGLIEDLLCSFGKTFLKHYKIICVIGVICNPLSALVEGESLIAPGVSLGKEEKK